MLGQHLDRHRPVEARVLRAVDLAHAAGAQRAEDLVRTKTRTVFQGHLPSVLTFS